MAGSSQMLTKSLILFVLPGRLTEFKESDVFVCESQYKEQEQLMRKIKALKKYSVSNKVIDDEIYFFKKPITPLKEPSPLLQPEVEDEEEAAAEANEAEDEQTETSSVASTPKAPKVRTGLDGGGE